VGPRTQEGSARTLLPRIAPERARFQRRFGAENRKPTIAQWSVFLPRCGPCPPAGERVYSLTAGVALGGDSRI